MRANWIKGRKNLFANALFFLSRTARRTWKQHWLSEYTAGHEAEAHRFGLRACTPRNQSDDAFCAS
jgi:hypothetical protein